MENYYSNSQRWVFDSDGNYLHSKGDNYNPNIQREGYFFNNIKHDEYLDFLHNQWIEELRWKKRKI